jgi:hypothetical protein
VDEQMRSHVKNVPFLASLKGRPGHGPNSLTPSKKAFRLPVGQALLISEVSEYLVIDGGKFYRKAPGDRFSV